MQAVLKQQQLSTEPKTSNEGREKHEEEDCSNEKEEGLEIEEEERKCTDRGSTRRVFSFEGKAVINDLLEKGWTEYRICKEHPTKRTKAW